MTDTRETTIREGHEAAAILANPVFLRAMDEVRASCVNQFLQSAPGDTAIRERAYGLAGLLEVLLMRLRSAMNDGKVAADDLARERDAAEAAKAAA